MTDIERYFDRIDSLIRHSIVVDDDVSYRRRGTKGVIRGTLWFHDDSRLQFVEVIRLVGRDVEKLRYRYQYLKGDQTSLPLRQLGALPESVNVSTSPARRK